MSRWCEAVSLGGTREGGGLSIRPFSEGPRNLKQAKDIFISGKIAAFTEAYFSTEVSKPLPLLLVKLRNRGFKVLASFQLGLPRKVP